MVQGVRLWVLRTKEKQHQKIRPKPLHAGQLSWPPCGVPVLTKEAASFPTNLPPTDIGGGGVWG